MPASSSPAGAPPPANRTMIRQSTAPWLILFLVLLIPVVGIGVFFGYRWTRLQAAIADQGEIATVLDRYLSLLEAKDAEASQKFLARSVEGDLARQQVTETRLAKAHLYENYKSLVLDDVQVKSDGASIEARVYGTVEYENGTRRKLTTSLDRDGHTWLVNGLKIEEAAAERNAADE
jgi:hypothetical protein